MQRVRQYFFIFLLLIATFLLGYNYFYRPFELANQSTGEIQVAQESLSNKVQSPENLTSQLKSQEKIALLLATPVTVETYFADEQNVEPTASDEAEVVAVQKELPVTGFYTLFGTDVSFAQAQTVVADIKKQYGIVQLRPSVAVDHEGGSVQRLSGDGFTPLDSWKELCAMETVDRQALLKQSARELRTANIDIVLAPVLDVGNNKILKDRVCSVDSYPVVADRSMDFVTIFTNVGITPVLKHFPGIGQTKKDLHTAYDFVSVLENDVKLYKYILDQNQNIGVMTAHVGVTSQDKEVPCSVSPFCVNELNTAYPNILVFTDALEMKAALYDTDNPNVPKSLVQVSKEAILAGNTVLLYGSSVTNEQLHQVITELSKEYESNEQLRSLVDKSILKVIKYKLK